MALPITRHVGRPIDARAGAPARAARPAGSILTMAAIGLALLAIATPQAAATPIIDVGIHYLQPDTAGQVIPIFVSSEAESVAGLNFNVQIADGGLEAGGNIDGPTIEYVDIIGGDTVFAGNNTGQIDSLSLPQIWAQTTTTATSTVVADDLLGILFIDTTGFMTGQFDLKLGDTLNGDTDFAGIAIDITNGLIIIPEPSILGLLAIGMFAGLRRRRSAR